MCASARVLTTTRWRRPAGRVIVITSPGLISRWGRAAAPFRSTLPPLQARWASDRVLNRHATSSQMSIRNAVTMIVRLARSARSRSADCPRQYNRHHGKSNFGGGGPVRARGNRRAAVGRQEQEIVLSGKVVVGLAVAGGLLA